jgi:hypothetical protein
MSCEKTGWACRSCVKHDVECTYTNRTTHYTIHLARKPSDEELVDPKFKGWERKQIRFATKSMVLFHDMLQTTVERARVAEQALAASNKGQMVQVIKQASANGQALRSEIRRAKLKIQAKDTEVANMRLQMQTIQSKETEKNDEIKALRLEIQRLNAEVFRLGRANPAAAAPPQRPAGGRGGPRIRDRRGERARLKARKQQAAVFAAAEPAPASAFPPAPATASAYGPAPTATTATAPATTIDLTAYEPQPPNPYSYAYPEPQPTAAAAGRAGTSELMSADNFNLLQQATYDFNALQQQQPQQQTNDPYGGVDPALFANNAPAGGLGNQFGGLDEQLFVTDDTPPEEIARLIEEQDARNASAAGQGNAGPSGWFVSEAYGGAGAPQASAYAQPQGTTQPAQGAREGTFDPFAVPNDMPSCTNDPTNAPSGYVAAGAIGPSWLTGEETQRNTDGDGDDMMMD